MSKGPTAGKEKPGITFSWREICEECSGRECRNPAGESPATPVARFRRVAIPQFMLGNRMLIAWCKRPSCPVDLVLQR